jgi:nicotinamide riboside transporter PnuC
MSPETWKKWRLLIGIVCLAMVAFGSIYAASASEWPRAAGLTALILGASVLLRKFIRTPPDA